MIAGRYRGQQRRVERRQRVRRLLELADHLGEADRLLVEHVLRHGLPLSELARITHQPTRTLQLRLVRILNRMSQKDFLFIARRAHRIDPATRAVARRVVCHGLPYRRAAAQLGLSLHQVRRRMDRFHRLFHARPPARAQGSAELEEAA